MDPIKIESTIPKDKINGIIENIPIKKDVSIRFEEYENRSRYIFSLNKEKLYEDYFLLDTLTKFVEEVILKFYTDKIISLRLDEKIGLIEKSKRLEIIEDVKEVLNSTTLFLKEKKKVKKEIFDYFLENKTLVIDGYLKFRSKSFHDLVDRSIELVLGDFQMEVEYNEFIDTLKFLIESQKSEIDLINIIFKDGKYDLLNESFKPIDNTHINTVLESLYDEDSNDESVSHEDVLLSTIIALSPRRIIMHGSDKYENDLSSILKEIFGDRMEICKGCKQCNIESP
nr:sporulation protein YtxC [Tissierella sp.]